MIMDLLMNNDFIFDPNNNTSSFLMDEQNIPKFVFRVRYFFPLSTEVEDDESTLDLLYAQALYDCIHLHYPHTLQDALLLSALQLQSANGDFIVGKEIKEFRSSSTILQLCCAPWIMKEEMTASEAEVRITNLYKKLVTIPKVKARNMFLQYIQSWKLYGSKYFCVKGQVDAPNGSGIAHELMLAINPRSVIVIDANNNHSFLAEYSYDQIQSWGHSFDSLALTVGNKDNQSKSYFRTVQGKEIEELLKIYSQNFIKGRAND
jgi:hypothetical protein